MSGGFQSGVAWVIALALAAIVAGGCGSAERGRAASGSAAARPVAGSLRVAELDAYLAAHPDALLLDVRNPSEWNDDVGHLDGAKLIPLPELTSRLGEIEGWRQKPVIVICRVGARSATAATLLADAGFATAFNLEGGMEAYRAAHR